MAKTIFSNPFADVDIQPVQVAGVQDVNRIAVRVKDDEGDYQLAGVLGKDYQLLPNRRVRDYAEDIMSRASKDYGTFAPLKTMFDGKRYVDYFASSEPIYDDDLKLKLGLMIWNSYDGTRKTGIEIFALNPFCTNQYHSRNRLGYFAWRHTPGEGVDVDEALTQLSVGASNVIKIAPKLKELKQIELKTSLMVDIAKGTEFPLSKWGEVLLQLNLDADNAFHLYQAMTNVASHKMHGLNAINVGSQITEAFMTLHDDEIIHHTDAEEVFDRR